jgi:hypothetical protein
VILLKNGGSLSTSTVQAVTENAVRPVEKYTKLSCFL